MILETFFDNFELLADAPNGVQKLRELILQLAVQGKIVPQYPTDEPASVLLEKIKAEKERLIKEKKVKKHKLLPPVEVEDLSFEIPDGWQSVRLGSIYEFAYGKSLPEKARNEKGQVPVYGSNGIVGYHDEPLVTQPSLIVGRKGSSGSVNLANEPFWAIDTTYYVTPPKDINLFFSYYLIRSLEFRRFDKSTAIPGLNRQDAYSLIVGLPPSNEQKRIVAKVDQLMALCNELETRQQKRREGCLRLNNAAIEQLLTTHEPDDFSKHWQRICDNFDLLYSVSENIGKLRQAILQLAVQGKLVPQEPNDEPASVLLEKIKAEKERLIKEKKIRKDKPLPPIKPDEEPYELPEGWNWVRVGETAKVIEYGTSEKASEIDVGTPILRMNNIDAEKVLCRNLKYVTSSIKDLPRLYLCHNDILFNRTNSYELVGKPGVFKGENDSFTFASYLIRVSLFLEFVQPDFVNIAMNSEYYRKTQLEPEITQQTGQANFNGTKLANTMIPLPPLAEQKRIVTKVDQLTILCDELEAKLIQSQTDSEKLGMDLAVRHVLTS